MDAMHFSSKAARSLLSQGLLSVAGMAIFTISALAAPPAPAPVPGRSLKICVASDAPPEIRRAAQTVLAAAATQPLLQVMGKENAPTELTDTKALAAAKPEDRAYSHLIVIGLPNDPLVELLSQREARTENGGLYIYGWGHLRGDIGYAESGRNPVMHSEQIPAVPYETEFVTLTGATPKGVEAAVHAFLKGGIFAGVIAGPGWVRTQPGLLDRDPVSPDAGAPAWVPATVGTMKRIGVLSGGEDEYRGVLADAGKEPLEIWRVKYLGASDWDCGSDYRDRAAALFEAGLHRRASGNTLWLARFASPQEAAESMKRMATATKLQAKGAVWYGERPGFSKGPSAGPFALWQRGEWLLMSTLPATETSLLTASLQN